MTTKPPAVDVVLARRIHSAEIAQAMLNSGLPPQFILNALNLVAQDYRSAYELMALWREAGDSEDDRSEAVADLQELLDDVENRALQSKKPYIPYDQLKEVGQKIIEYKGKLRAIIDRHGGVTRVAELSGIPQPSLSRMLNSASMPRKTTLYKIADALQLSETEIAADFVW